MWETKDVLMLVLAVGGVAVTWGIVRTQVGTLQNEVRELKREVKASQQKQGERIGDLELISRVQKEVAQERRRAGTLPQSAMEAALLAANAVARSAPRSGQVTAPVDDGGSEHDDDEQRR